MWNRPKLSTFRVSALSLDKSRYGLPGIERYDEIPVERYVVSNPDQSTLPSSLNELMFVAIEGSPIGHRCDINTAYKRTGNSPYLDNNSTIGICTKDRRELLAIAGGVDIRKTLVITQIQGSITKGVDFSTGLSYNKARRYLSFDWRSTFMNLFEDMAAEHKKRIALMPNNRSQWSTVRDQDRCVMSYDRLALSRGYEYSQRERLYIKPK